MPGAAPVYSGLVAALPGAASLVNPLAFLGIDTRFQDAVAFGIGFLIAVLGLFLFFRTLIRIRRFGRPGPEGIHDAPGHLPLLEWATRMR